MAYVPGIDVSEHQEAIDAHALGVAGIRHAVVRCADPITHRIDHFYVQNHTALTAAGVPCDTYVFARANIETPRSAADRYTAWARSVERPGRLWIDVEWEFDGGRKNAAGVYIPLLPPATCAVWLNELVARLELDGWAGALGIYTNANYWDARVGEAADPLGRLPLWISGYPFVSPPPDDPLLWEAWATRASSPRLPRPWRNAVEGFAIWQFTSSGTLVPGHGLDCNLVDPTLFTKDKPLPTPEVDVPIWIPDWAVDVGGRVQHYELVDGHTLIGWGCEIRDPANPDQPHPMGIQGPDGYVLPLTPSPANPGPTGGDPGPFAGPCGFRRGTQVVVTHGAATYAFPTGEEDQITSTPPAAEVDIAALAAAVTPLVTAAIVADLQD